MKLSKQALDCIVADRRNILELAIVLDKTEQGMRLILKKNKNNGPLTTLAAIECIKNLLAQSEKEILEIPSVERLSTAV